MSKKRNRIWLIALALVLAAALCAALAVFWKSPVRTAVIRVTETVWNDQPPPPQGYPVKESVYTVRAGDSITISHRWPEEITLKITAVDKAGVSFRVNRALSADGDVHDGESHFYLEKEAGLKLNTLTMDAGGIYTFSLEEIQAEKGS